MPRCGNLRSHPGQLIDAIIYGRDLGQESEDIVVEERFDKIRYYLKHGQYPDGADRTEKSRLRSAATQYKLLAAADGGPEKLMLKGKEVIAEPQRQYEFAKETHEQQHGGINKTTATIAERYHWVRIKETVSAVIKNCIDCKENPKPSASRPDTAASRSNVGQQFEGRNTGRKKSLTFEQLFGSGVSPVDGQNTESSMSASDQDQEHGDPLAAYIHSQEQREPIRAANCPSYPHNEGLPVDPRIMEGVEYKLPSDSGFG